MPLIVPLGDLSDVLAINAEQSLAGDPERLSPLAQRYGAEDVLVTQAVPFADPEAEQITLEVGTTRLGQLQHRTVIDNFHQRPGETMQALYARVADTIDAEAQESWKQRNLLRPGVPRRISVAVPLQDLAAWLEIKTRLANVAGVQRSEVSLLSRGRGELDITFVGDEEQLALAMAQSDLSLSFDDGSGWRLVMSDARQPTSAAAAPAPEADSGVEPEVQPGAGPTTPQPSATAPE